MTCSPAVVGNSVYFGSWDSYIYCLNTKNGDVNWKLKTGGSVTSSPDVVNGVVYIGSWDGYVYALDAKDGVVI